MTHEEACKALWSVLDHCKRHRLTQSTVSAEYATAYGEDYADFIVDSAWQRKMEAMEIGITGKALTFRLRHLDA